MPGTVLLLLAAVFVLAATAKLRSRTEFREVLHDLVPASVVPVLSIAIPIIELAIAVTLLGGRMPREAAIAAGALLGVFTIVLVVLWRRGAKSCGCFGETTDKSNNGSGIIRNMILLVLTAYVLAQHDAILLWGPDFGTLLGRFTVVAGSLCLWVCLVAIYNRRNFIFNYSADLPS